MVTKEALGPAERIIQTVLSHSDHAVHNRAGMVTKNAGSVIGATWVPVTHVEENGQKVVYELRKVGKTSTKVRVGLLQEDGSIKEGTRLVGRYQPAGVFPEAATWLYNQVAEVWKLDNEFAAKWASYAYTQEHRDLKVILAAFLLVQSRKGDPVLDAGKIAFHDEDLRDVGEAMLLLSRKEAGGSKDFNPKLLLRVNDVLRLPGVAEINRTLGFGQSPKHPFLGRWTKATDKWLRYREENSKMLEGLVKAGFRSTVMELARRVGYKPTSSKFFEILRWKQVQSEDGRRALAIGQAVKAAESWEGLSEAQICEKIVATKPNFKRIVGFLPKGQGLTQAIVAAAIEAGSLSDKDLIIATPTLEDLGLLDVPEIKQRWETAIKSAEDMRAANIATRVRSKSTQDALQGAADNALQKAVAEVVKGLRVYVIVDISGSMQSAIEQAKKYLAKFVQAFPLTQLHVSVFNTTGREVKIQHATAVGVEQAFRGITAGGGTSHAAGVRAIQAHKPNENEDALFIFVGDEQDGTFAEAVRRSGINPVAFGMLHIPANGFGGRDRAVLETATELQIPCFPLDEGIFADPYAVPRTLRNLIAATPVGQKATHHQLFQRVTLVDTILAVDLLKKPTWAA